ncbi:hypothetical protein CDL62_09640 [Alkalitalea saponilacus]|uniref:Trypsin n=2 Tax=Alkalitalea saponilacus TaxID=889453 RepID=A0A1T5HMP9_9BACT|nr:hypothetical protein CDL62_09640 [Alkalitalea saponilacus]SKC21946.1 Trypsin [Alkalitalea saponilacus]
MKASMKLFGLLFIISYISVSYTDLHKESRENPYPFVVSIFSKNCINNSNYGTGFIAKHNGALFLITAAHVALLMRDESVIQICNSDLSQKTINLIDIVKDRNINWQVHEIADMAILEIPKIETYFEVHSKHAVSSEKFIVNKYSVKIGDSFLHVSYPLANHLSFGNTTVFTPYVFKTYSINYIMKRPRIDNPNIISAQISVSPCSYQGSSGGPLIYSQSKSDDFQIVGISHGSTREPQFNNTLMSIFTPMYYFFDIVERK